MKRIISPCPRLDENLEIVPNQKCSLKLIKVNGARSHHRRHGGTYIFECSKCYRRFVFKRRQIQYLIRGGTPTGKYKRYGPHMMINGPYYHYKKMSSSESRVEEIR